MAKKIIHELVFPFETTEFLAVWEIWLQYRSEIKKPYKSMISAQLALKKLSQYPEKIAIQMLYQSMENGWQGIFELKFNMKAGPISKVETYMSESTKGREILKQMQDNDRSSKV